MTPGSSPGVTESVRRRTLRVASRKAQALADAELAGFFEHGVAERDVAERQAAMPEQDGLGRVGAAGPEPGDDLAELGVEVGRGELAAVDMAAQRSQPPRRGLAPII